MSIVAVVVGIERYDGPWPALDGPGPDAYRVVRWLRRNGVPAEDVYLHLSPLTGSAAGLPRIDVAPRPATREAIFHGTLRALRQRRADELLVFWGGHGAADAEERRYLFYQDSGADWETHLDLNGLVRALRTERYRFPRQLLVIDACGNFIEEMGLDAALPADAVPRGRAPGVAERQSVLYASMEGFTAANDNWRRTGVLTAEVLHALDEDPHFPPRADRIWPRVKARLDEARAAGRRAQVPAVYDVVVDGAARERRVRDPGVPPPRGRIDYAPILYDRKEPAERFAGLVQRQLAGAPVTRAYVVFGEEHEQHRTFARRVRATSLQDRVDARFAGVRGCVGEIGVVEWPGGDLYVPALEDAVRAKVAECAGVDDRLPEDGAALLRAWRPHAEHAVVLVTHFVRLERWSDAQRRLLCWYLDDYWTEARRVPGMPHVVLLLLVECRQRMAARTLMDRLAFRPAEKERLARALRAVATGRAAGPSLRPGAGAPPAGRGCGCEVLPELVPLEVRHVTEWFDRFLREPLRLAPAACETRAKVMLSRVRRRRDQIPCTDDIEAALQREYEAAESHLKGAGDGP
jgi:hypothetical protein